MIRPFAFVLALALMGLASTCGTTPPQTCCGTVTTLARSVEYRGTLDAGTEVTVNVSTNNNVFMTFTRDGHTIGLGFSGVTRIP